MDKKLRNIIIYITVAVMVVLGVAFLMTKNSSESYTTSQLVNLFKRGQGSELYRQLRNRCD